MNLLRRILLADHVATDLRPIPLGLSARPYTRLVLTVPGSHAQPLDADLLTPWRDARVWAVWRTVAGQRMVGAALAVGADGPEPLTALRERGWIGIVAPQALVRQAHQPEVLPLPYGWRWTTPAHMLLPRRLTAAPSAATAPAHAPIITPAPDDAGSALHTSAEAPAVPFMVAGRVMGMLTAALVAQTLDTFATSDQQLLAPEPLITPTLDPEMLDPETSATPRARPRPERRWTVVGTAAAQEDTEDTDGVEDSTTGEALPLSGITAPMEDAEATSAPQEVAETAPVAAAEPTSAANVEAPAPTPVPTVDHAPTPAPPCEAPAPIRWVAGPNLTADEVASLMQAIVQTDRLYTGRPGQYPGQYGLSIRMMKELFTLGRLDAEPLLVWLDAAELVVAPPDSSNPWLRPRPLITRDLMVIAARLAATPLPTESAIAASFRKK
jgi:hypothetical protein